MSHRSDSRVSTYRIDTKYETFCGVLAYPPNLAEDHGSQQVRDAVERCCDEASMEQRREGPLSLGEHL